MRPTQNRYVQGRFVVAGCLAALALAACTPISAESPDPSPSAENGMLAATDPAFESGGVLDIQLDYDTAEAGGLDPQLATAAHSWMLESLVYETLVTTDADLAVQPGLATSWETTDDLAYTFTLRDDAVFSNGRAMTADDVAGSLNRLHKSGSVWAAQLGPVESIKADDEGTVTITLSAPYTPLLAALANTPAGILPMEEIEAGDLDPATEMLGTGPLVVADHRQDVSWSFDVNSHYPAELGFTGAKITIAADENSRIAALRDGSTDFAFFSSIDAADLLSSTTSATVLTQANSDYFYAMINSRRPDSSLADQEVRHAINAAIDREQLADVVFDGQAEPTAITPVTLPDSCAPAELGSATMSDADIEAILKPLALKINLLIYTSEPALAQQAQLIQQSLEKFGVTLEIEQFDYATYSSRVYATDPADFDIALGWYAGYADPAMVTRWWNPTLAGFSGVFMTGNEAVNSLIDKGASTPVDDPSRADTFTELCEATDQQSEMVPLITRPTVVGFNNTTLSPTIYATEGYGNVLKLLTTFRATP